MAKIYSLIGDSTDPAMTSGLRNVNAANLYPSTLTATPSGLSLGVELLSNYDRFNLAQTGASTDFVLLPSASTSAGARIYFYAISACSLKAGADASGYTINGGADTAKYAIAAGNLVVIERATATNWIADVVGDAATETLTGKTLVTPVFSGSPTGDGVPQWAEVSMTNAEILALRATPKTIVAAPGAGKVVELLAAQLFFDYTAAYTESADNFGFKYGTGAGTEIATVENTGFVDATADTMTRATISAAANIAKTAVDNLALVLHNTGDGELGGGDAANVIRVRALYRINPAGW